MASTRESDRLLPIVELADALQRDAALEHIAAVRELPDEKPLPDSTSKYLGLDGSRRACAFVLVSSSYAPGMVQRSVSRAQAAREILPAGLREAVLMPLRMGHLGDRSFAVFPLRRPMQTGRIMKEIDKLRFGRKVLNWLSASVEATITELERAEIEQVFVQPLTSIVQATQLSEALRSCAENAIESIMAGHWRPRTTLMHNDFWWGNILAAPPAESGGLGFQVTDWAGSEIRGYPVYDSLRMTSSLGLNKQRVKEILENHARHLSCGLEETSYYTTAALGHLLNHLEEFPFERYMHMADSMYQRWRTAVA